MRDRTAARWLPTAMRSASARIIDQASGLIATEPCWDKTEAIAIVVMVSFLVIGSGKRTAVQTSAGGRSH
jgi:hypothetical protein